MGPVGLGKGDARVFRGGSWNIDAEGCRSAYRGVGWPDGSGYDQGFRVCLVPGPAAEPRPQE